MKVFTRSQAHHFPGLAARLYLGSVFILASIHKIINPEVFALDIATYDIVPLSLINLMAICLPWLELVCGILFVTGYKSRAAAWLISGMMAMFLCALLLALHKGLNMSCGCFASSSITAEDAISGATVFRDLAWLLLGIYVLVFDRHPIGIEQLLLQRKKKR